MPTIDILSFDPIVLDVCPVCKRHAADVDLEVLNVAAEDSVSLQVCILCATDITARAFVPISVDVDCLMYANLGTVAGNN